MSEYDIEQAQNQGAACPHNTHPAYCNHCSRELQAKSRDAATAARMAARLNERRLGAEEEQAVIKAAQDVLHEFHQVVLHEFHPEDEMHPTLYQRLLEMGAAFEALQRARGE